MISLDKCGFWKLYHLFPIWDHQPLAISVIGAKLGFLFHGDTFKFLNLPGFEAQKIPQLRLFPCEHTS